MTPMLMKGKQLTWLHKWKKFRGNIAYSFASQFGIPIQLLIEVEVAVVVVDVDDDVGDGVVVYIQVYNRETRHQYKPFQ